MIVSKIRYNKMNRDGLLFSILLRHVPAFLFGMAMYHIVFIGRNDKLTIGQSSSSSSRMLQQLQGPDWTSSSSCPGPISESQRQTLKEEIEDYEKSSKFQDKIEEVKGENKVAIHHVAINNYLQEKLLQPNWSILELGCATGKMIHMVESYYKESNHPYKDMVGIELVPGWVRFAQSYYPSIESEIQIYEGDVTDFTPLPAPHTFKTFDFIMLNDVAEHIQKERYGCLFQQLQHVTHSGSLIYFHTPNPQAQLTDKNQYYENVLPHAFLIAGMAQHGFELVQLEQDIDTDANNHKMSKDTKTMAWLRTKTKCEKNGYPKYYHAIFRRVPGTKQGVFQLQ